MADPIPQLPQHDPDRSIDELQQRVARLRVGLLALGGTGLALVVVTAVGARDASQRLFDTFQEMQSTAAGLGQELAKTRDLTAGLEARVAAAVADATRDLDELARQAVRRAAETRIDGLVRESRSTLDRTSQLSDRLDERSRDLDARLLERFGSIADSLGGRIDTRVEEAMLRVESGSIEARTRELRTGTSDRRERGRVRFAKPFPEPPHVTLGLRRLDLPRSDRPRLEISVVSKDERGFDYQIRTWGRSTIEDIAADWIALGADRQPTELAPPAAR